MPGEQSGYHYTDSYGDAGMTAREEFSIRYYLDLLRRRIWILVPVVLASTTLGIMRAARAPRIYQSTARILVERQAARIAMFDGMQEYSGWDPGYYKTQADLIRSRVVMEMALEQPGVRELFAVRSVDPVALPATPADRLRSFIKTLLGTTPPAPAEPWERLRDQIQTDIAKESHFIIVRVDSIDAQRAALLANAAAKAFEEYHLQQKVEALGDAFVYLKKEKDKEELELRKAELTLQDFREKATGVTLSVAEENQPTRSRLVALNERLTAVEMERSTLRAQIEVMKNALDPSTQPTVADEARLLSLPILEHDATLSGIRSGLDDSERELTLLSNTYGPQHPQYQAAMARRELVRRQLRVTLSQLVQAYENRLKVLESESRDLQVQYEEQRKIALELAREAFTFTHLQNAVDRHAKLYDALVKRMLEVDVSSGLVRTNVQVVEEAPVPQAPITPRRMRTVMVSVFAGLFIGIALSVLVEKLDDAVKTPEDLKLRVGAPFLGFVPGVPLGKKPGDLREAFYRATISLREPISSAAEAYRSIRTNLFYSIPAGEVKTIAVVSSTPREGKTTTATNLAIIVAQSGKKVLLIDADLHRAMLHRILGVDGKLGLTNVLVGECDWRKAVTAPSYRGQPVPNLELMPAGPESPNPAELLGSRVMREFLAEVRDVYDWIVVDTPPVLFVSDSSIVSAVCDGVVLVVRSGATNSTSLTRTREQLENVKVRILGTILNRPTISRMGRYYSAYYYHGYSRYSRDYHRSYGSDGRKSSKTPASPGETPA